MSSPRNLVKNQLNLGIFRRHSPPTTLEVRSWRTVLRLRSSPAYTETQVFETGHKPNVKKLTNFTNRKDSFFCISNHHERSACLSKLNQAVSRPAKVLARGKSEVDASSSSSSDSVERGNDDLPRASRPWELAVKLPLWDLSFDLEALHKEAESVGNRGRGRQLSVLAACKSGAPFAPSASKAVARFSYEWSRHFPNLKYLPTQLVDCVCEFWREIGIASEARRGP